MDFPICLHDLDIGDEDEKKRMKERDPYACACAECPTCGGGKKPLRVRRRVLKRAMERDDTRAVAALLHCSTCWPENCLQRYVKNIHTEAMACTFAEAAHDFFFNKGHGAGALQLAARKGRAGTVRALLAAGTGLAADATVPGKQVKALPMACLHRQALCVEALLEKGADPNQRLMDGLTPLHLAAWAGAEGCVEALLRWGAGVEAASDKGYTPLHCAAAPAFIPCVKLLLDAGADPNTQDKFGRSSLHYSARDFLWLILPRDYHWIQKHRQENYHDCSEELLKYGADVNIVDNEGICPLFNAAEVNDAEVIKVLLRYGVNIFHKRRGETVLHRIARGTGGSCVEVFRDRGLDANALDDQGVTPLHDAVCYNYLAVKGLLEMGADVSVRDREGYTALHRAASLGVEESVQELLRVGADPNQTVGEGFTALHFAAKFSRSKCVVDLLDSGANVNARSTDGKTPLHCSAYPWSLECMEELWKRGADMPARDNAGWNAMHFAAFAGAMHTIKFLSKEGLSMEDRTADGRTPLHLAAIGMTPGCLASLIRTCHPQLNARDNVGRTPLHVAAQDDNEENVRELLLAGADRTARDKDGESPADVAITEEVRRVIGQWTIAG